MNFIAIIMTPSMVFRQCLQGLLSPIQMSIQMYLAFVYMILLNRAGMIDLSNVSIGTHIS